MGVGFHCSGGSKLRFWGHAHLGHGSSHARMYVCDGISLLANKVGLVEKVSIGCNIMIFKLYLQVI